MTIEPGMPADVTIDLVRRDDLLRVPARPLRFRPTAETRSAPGQSAETVTAKSTARTSEEARKAGRGTVRVFDGGLNPIALNTGATGGVYTEVVGWAVAEGTAVATSVDGPASTPKPAAASRPLLPQQAPCSFSEVRGFSRR